MYFVYALYAPKYDKIYVGQSEDVSRRLEYHNVIGIKGWTIKYRPWVVIHTEEVGSRVEALRREKQLKSAKGREFVWQLVETYKKTLRGGAVGSSLGS